MFGATGAKLCNHCYWDLCARHKHPWTVCHCVCHPKPDSSPEEIMKRDRFFSFTPHKTSFITQDHVHMASNFSAATPASDAFISNYLQKMQANTDFHEMNISK